MPFHVSDHDFLLRLSLKSELKLLTLLLTTRTTKKHNKSIVLISITYGYFTFFKI